MTDNAKPEPAIKRGSKIKTILFALVPTLLLLYAATALLLVLEKKKIIHTERPDDRVAHAPVNLLVRETIDDREMIRTDSVDAVPQTFAADKPEGVFRIMIAGGSFAMGSPFVHQAHRGPNVGGIGDWLRAELTMRYPSLDFEVINGAMGGRNSTAVVGVFRELAVYDPDLFLVATGNNEGYLPQTGFNQVLHRWIVYRSLKKTILTEPDATQRSHFMPQDEDAAEIEKLFCGNIERIVRIADKQKVRLMLATLPINLTFYWKDIPGRYGQLPSFTSDDPVINKGYALQKEGSYQEAIEVYAQSQAPTKAALFIGQCLLALGDYGEVKKFFKYYTQHNPQSRARPSYNEFVRRLAKERNLLLADLEAEAERLSPNGLPGSNLFLDSCHLNWRGYQQMAAQIVRVLVERRVIPGAPGEPKPAPTVEEMIERFGWRHLYGFTIGLDTIQRGFADYDYLPPSDK